MSSATSVEQRKTFGAFYTPSEFADALARWAVRSSDDRVLEPAAGEAVFLVAAIERLRALGCPNAVEQVVGVEIDPRARQDARAMLAAAGHDCRVDLADFFAVSTAELGGSFDAVIGNPPFVRYHRFRGEARLRGLRAAENQGIRLSRLTSSWAPFVVHASAFLRANGRLALVLPAELLHVDYAGPVRQFLLRRFASLTVVTFDRAVFPGALIDMVLLLAEDGATSRGLRVLALSDASALAGALQGTFVGKPHERWSHHRAPGEGVAVLEVLRGRGATTRLAEIASVDIGCVTGANAFFLLTRSEADALQASPRILQPTIARPSHLVGAIATAGDLDSISGREKSLLLRLDAPGLDRADDALGRYLAEGARRGISARFKCRSRRPWYAVPSVHVPDAFLSYMAHHSPRVALNAGRLSSTNLVHQVNLHAAARRQTAACVAALHSSIAQLSFELEGRSYGGGVLKLETREAERVEIPLLDPEMVSRLESLLPSIDEAVRRGDPARATVIVDDVLTRRGVLARRELEALQSTRLALQERRLRRGRTSA